MVSQHRTSAQNCARIYNEEAQAYPWGVDLPADWPVTYDMHSEHVSEAFVIHALLEWHHDHNTVLEVPHKADNARIGFHEAVEARNRALAGPGHPEWNHACLRCTHHIKDDTGQITAVYRSAVSDGISLGHPCCALHDCKIPLANNKHRYCPTHSSMRDECVVEACSALAIAPFHTCEIPSHRLAEERHLERSKAMFQLKHRLAKSSRRPNDVTHALQPHEFGEADDLDSPVGHSSVLSPDTADIGLFPEDEVAVDVNGEVLIEGCDKKPAGGHRKVFARFGRRRTHNDELCVASCGMILGRATFYGAEGPNSVRVSI